MTKAAGVKLKPVYLILGDQPTLVDFEIAKIKKAVGRDALEYNLDQFDAAQISGFQIASAANTPPFMSDHRLVLVRGVDQLLKEDAAALVDYVKNPFPSTCLVMVGETLSEKSALYKAVLSAGEVMVRRAEKDKLPLMVKKAFEKRGQVASNDVIRYLVTAVGEDLTRLGQEIEKVSLYCMDEKVIDLEETKRVVTNTNELKIFELVDRIGMRDKPGALQALEQLLTSGFERKPKSAASESRTRRRSGSETAFRMVSTEEHIRSVFNLMVSHFRTLLRVRALAESGAGGHEIIAKLAFRGTDRTKNFLLGKYRRQGENFTLDELKRATPLFLKADLALKSTGSSPESVLERLVVSLASL